MNHSLFYELSQIILFSIFIVFIGLITITILYLVTLQNTINATNIKNRSLQPSEVWITLIPIIGLILHLGIVAKIQTTLKKDFKEKGIEYDESQFGTDFAYKFCVLQILNSLIILWSNYKIGIDNNYFSTRNLNFILSISIVLSIISLLYWIAYWIRISNCKSILFNYNQSSNSYTNTKYTYSNSYNNPENLKTCNNCGAESLIENNYCMECGSSDFKSNIKNNFQEDEEIKEKYIITENEKECPNCNFIINKNHNKCDFCDYEFISQEKPIVNDFKIDSQDSIKESNDKYNNITGDKVNEDYDYVEENKISKSKIFVIMILILMIGFFVWYNFFNIKLKQNIGIPSQNTSISVSDTSSDSIKKVKNIQTVEEYSKINETQTKDEMWTEYWENFSEAMLSKDELKILSLTNIDKFQDGGGGATAEEFLEQAGAQNNNESGWSNLINSINKGVTIKNNGYEMVTNSDYPILYFEFNNNKWEWVGIIGD